MINLTELQQTNDHYFNEVFKALDGAHRRQIAGDEYLECDSNLCETLQNIQYEHTVARYAEHGIETADLSSVRQSTQLKIAGDALINRANGIGTMLDPSVYTHSTVPVMISPWESTNLYASGGLPQTIIDKKSRAMCSNGINLKSVGGDFWTPEKIAELQTQSQVTGLDDILSDAVSDALVYGGSVLFPIFKTDGIQRRNRRLANLGIEKGEIDRWVSVDRWNVTTVPSYIVTSTDYINPKRIFIPMSSMELSTERCAIIRPHPMPYWAVLYNIGWSPTDYSGWIRSYYGYEITMQSIPVMAQQMSLLLYRLPLDALNATIGVDKVRELMAINETKMKEWSAVDPKAVNMIGEVEVINRTYSGFDQFVGAMKSDLAAQCDVPEPTLWHTPNKGFSDNTQESLLKQSETMQLRQTYIERSMHNVKDILIAHTYGQDSEEYQQRDLLHLTFDKPQVSSEKDLAETGARFAATVNSLVQGTIPPDTAIQIAETFFPSAKITDEQLTAVKAAYEEAQEQGTLNSQVKGTGHSFASSGNAGNIGHVNGR